MSFRPAWFYSDILTQKKATAPSSWVPVGCLKLLRLGIACYTAAGDAYTCLWCPWPGNGSANCCLPGSRSAGVYPSLILPLLTHLSFSISRVGGVFLLAQASLLSAGTAGVYLHNTDVYVCVHVLM